MTQARQEFLSAARDISPLAVGVAVYGLAFGLLAAQASMDELQTGVMGTLLFAGASQIVAVERLVAGAGATAAIIAGVALNLRITLMTAAVGDVFAERPFWQVAFGAHMTTDENWALMLATRNQGQNVGYWYLIGGGVILMATWLMASISGVAFATAIPGPNALGMDFAFTAAFIAIARSMWTGRRDPVPWAVSFAIVSLSIGTGTISSNWALILGGIGGAVIAGVSENG